MTKEQFIRDFTQRHDSTFRDSHEVALNVAEFIARAYPDPSWYPNPEWQPPQQVCGR